MKVLMVSTGTRILNTSLNVNPGLNGWDEDGGSDSYYGFGDDE